MKKNKKNNLLLEINSFYLSCPEKDDIDSDSSNDETGINETKRNNKENSQVNFDFYQKTKMKFEDEGETKQSLVKDENDVKEEEECDYKDLISTNNTNKNINKKIKIKSKASHQITSRLLSNQDKINNNNNNNNKLSNHTDLIGYYQYKDIFPKDDTSFIKTKKKLSIEMELTSSDGMRKSKNEVKTHKIKFKTKKIDVFSLESDDSNEDLQIVKANTMNLTKVCLRERSMSSIIYKLERGRVISEVKEGDENDE